MTNERIKELYDNMLNHMSELVSGTDLIDTLRAIGFTPKEIADEGFGDFGCIGNNRLEAYGSHMNFEMGFENPEVRVLITFDEFCKELDKGYGNSRYIEIARLYEDADGKIWYDNDYAG